MLENMVTQDFFRADPDRGNLPFRQNTIRAHSNLESSGRCRLPFGTENHGQAKR
jgi:hypothetical protein